MYEIGNQTNSKKTKLHAHQLQYFNNVLKARQKKKIMAVIYPIKRYEIH